MNTLRKLTLYSVGVALLALSAVEATAQQADALPGEQLASQNLRPYWLVFIAYAIAIVLVMVWAGSIAKRLREVESRLGE
jgi:NADH:ubiquinone oxidoreductase subunit 6 (subunit J)